MSARAPRSPAVWPDVCPAPRVPPHVNPTERKPPTPAQTEGGSWPACHGPGCPVTWGLGTRGWVVPSSAASAAGGGGGGGVLSSLLGSSGAVNSQ